MEPPAPESSGQSGRYLGQASIRKSQDHNEGTGEQASKGMIYKVGDMVFLDSRNITTSRLSKKLDDKMLELFKRGRTCISTRTAIDNEDSP